MILTIVPKQLPATCIALFSQENELKKNISITPGWLPVVILSKHPDRGGVIGHDGYVFCLQLEALIEEVYKLNYRLFCCFRLLNLFLWITEQSTAVTYSFIFKPEKVAEVEISIT